MPYAKAIVSALIAFLTALATALTDGGVTPTEWITAVIAGLVALGVTYGVPNTPQGD